MTLTKQQEQIFKTDVLGRVKTPPEHREKLLDEFENSGLSGTKFAELAGVKYQTFATWSQQRRRQRKQYPVKNKPAAKPLPQLQWLEAVVEKQNPPANLSVLVIHLPGGVRVEVADASQAALAAALLRSLDSKQAFSC